MKRNILIVGRGFRRLNSYIEQHGYDYLILSDTRRPVPDDPRYKACDFISKETVLETVDELKNRMQIDAVIAIYENYILPAALIAEHLSLPGLPVSAAEACTDKQLMREMFAKASEPISPDYKIVSSKEDLIDFTETHKFPLILKPANLAKSLLVTKSHDLKELLENYETTLGQIDQIYEKYAPHRKPKILIEDFLEGSIHSVDAFVDGDGKPHVLNQVVDYQTGYDVGYDDNFHYSRLLPSRLEPELIQEIRRIAKIGCEALGMKNSPAHIEVIVTDKGPRIVEIGARNGGYRERMHGIANGIDINGIALKVAFGEPFSVKSEQNDSCAVLELFPKITGNFSHISNQDKLELLQSLAYFNCKVKQGDVVGKAAHGHKMCAVVMLHNKDHEQFARDLDYVNKNVYVVTS